MLKTVRDACQLHTMALDYTMTDAIENLADLISDEGDGAAFFEKNYITHGMEELFREGLLRLGGKSDQAVFELAQAMGGGKTHLMIALGLLAKHPARRQEIVPKLAARAGFERARLAAFNGRNSPDYYLWGEIAEQLGNRDALRKFWINGPKAVAESDWKSLIGDDPTLIMLDELPPYLHMANTVPVGGGTLADVTTYSLATLFTAAMQLPRCCIVIANLSGSYHGQTQQITKLVANLQNEARRQSKVITPVQLAGNEVYAILKKRLFASLPPEEDIDEIAEAYAERIKAAEDGGYLTARSLEQVADEVRATYPFHPSFKHLVALFKENEGFRQTRGLMQFTARLLKSVWERPQNDVFLIGTQHLNLNLDSVRDEITRINGELSPAITKDVADSGSAHAEEIDATLNSDAGTQMANLLLSASLSRAVKGHVGLSREEAIEYLVAPNRRPDEFEKALESLKNKAWYLHREGELFYFKETENLTKRIEKDASRLPAPKVAQVLTQQLATLLQPRSRLAYQEVLVLPPLDKVNLGSHRVLLVVEPDGSVPPETIKKFYDSITEKNHLLVLSGNDSYLAGEVEQRLREFYAIERICKDKDLKPGDTLFEEAQEKHEELQGRFLKALSHAYNRLFYPGPEGLETVIIENGLSFGEGEHSAEHQIEKLLASSRCDEKLAAHLREAPLSYWAMAENDLWPMGERRTPWRDVLLRAKTNPAWPWMPGFKGLDTLKSLALEQGRWREGADGYLEKGPFPKEKTSVNITVQSTDRDTGEVTLTLTPRHAGPSPRVHYSTQVNVSVENPSVQDLDNFRTREATLYFLAVDPSGEHQTGEPVRWSNRLVIRHQIRATAEGRKVELKVVPTGTLRFTLNGINPKEGQLYEGLFAVPPEGAILQVYAHAGEAETQETIRLPALGSDQPQIDEAKPASLNSSQRLNLDTTEKTFKLIQAFREDDTTQFKGVQAIIGENEEAVTLRFNARPVTAAVIEQAVRALRQAIGDEQAPVQITIREGGHFRNGYELKRFAELCQLKLSPEVVIQ
ncbi:anti-phage-associated DUF499 domain-containing protein [Nitrosococcus wardiae]|uniref:DUF499 domain-containing protein n=1 Tax=Nitrosococcus wardiae TaxID=1814290 RepID=A0A4V1AVP3_9GAMM|nr:anti-phage-associated DUF499 domain-containing protein [Nitrosococcus wardiae]QBQ53835.1 DUF499 domain-containing protein [Nitrosococcus wardiae]